MCHCQLACPLRCPALGEHALHAFIGQRKITSTLAATQPRAPAGAPPCSCAGPCKEHAAQEKPFVIHWVDRILKWRLNDHELNRRCTWLANTTSFAQALLLMSKHWAGTRCIHGQLATHMQRAQPGAQHVH